MFFLSSSSLSSFVRVLLLMTITTVLTKSISSRAWQHQLSSSLSSLSVASRSRSRKTTITTRTVYHPFYPTSFSTTTMAAEASIGGGGTTGEAKNVASFSTTTMAAEATVGGALGAGKSGAVAGGAVAADGYWNRENSKSFLSLLLKNSAAAVAADDDATTSTSLPSSVSPQKNARILSLSPKNDPNNLPLENDTDRNELLAPFFELNKGAAANTNANAAVELVAVGSTVDELDMEYIKKEKVNVLFVSPGTSSDTLATVMEQLQDSLEWIHSRSAGIDVLLSDPRVVEAYNNNNNSRNIIMTNAKGTFSSTLAEYTMLACSYFAKDLPQLLKNKSHSKWKQYPVVELRGSTIGIIGFGDIGRAAAKLAKAYGMKVIALRRTIPSGPDDPYCDVVYDRTVLNKLFQQSDYVLCSAPLTPETYHMIGKEQFDANNNGLVFINVGRGPIVDEQAMIDALQDGRLKGAGLDVFTTEPLSEDSELWKLDNVLLSPHNMDMTDTFMLESTQFFIKENLPRFIYGYPLLNPVDIKKGY